MKTEIDTGLEIPNAEAHTPAEEPEATAADIEAPGDGESPESDTGEPTAQADEPEAEDATEDLTVQFGDEKPPEPDKAPAPAWVREVRKQNRELQRQNRELQRRLSEVTEKPPAALPKKPTLEECDYDAAAFEAKLLTWNEAQRQHNEAEARKRSEAERATADYQAKLAAYKQADVRRQPDFEEAEQAVASMLDPNRQGIILQGAESPENAALLVYALGKNEAKLKELAAIKDQVRFAFALAKLEATMKVSRRSAPAPERPVAGSVKPGASAGNAHLERLRAEADRTGDRTKVAAYLRQQREKGR